ncbi:NAD(P)/FAD-dependent oxidoreductase [Nannocystaceae bacterium ST9]
MTDAIVVGGGPAGAALATLLARAGRDVVLFERSAGPTDKVCGEFLSSEAVTYLDALGVDLASLGAVPITAMRLCEGRHTSTMVLPFAASSLSRRVLDEALLAKAASAGVCVRRGAKVRALGRCGSAWHARLDDGELVEADAAFLATGKHDLHGRKRPEGLQSDLVAFKLHYRLSSEAAAALAGHVELVLFDGGYAGLQMVEDGVANLCLLIRQQRLHALGHWDRVLAAIRSESAHLDARLLGAQPRWARPLAISAIPYGHVRQRSDGLWRLGDQAAVIPSFSGDGMSIALHSAELAATTYLEGGPADAYQRMLARDVTRQVFFSTLLSQGLVRHAGQRALGMAARAWPRLMSTVAFHTRVSDAALARAMPMRPN